MFEIVAMVAALLLMFACVVAKLVTTQLVHRMQAAIDRVGQDVARIQRELGAARSQKGTANMNRDVLARRRDKVAKQVGRLRAELKAMRDGEARRRELRDAARGVASGGDGDVSEPEE